jgi:hypothetical protein
MDNKKNALRGLALKGVFAAMVLGTAATASADQYGVQVALGTGDHHFNKYDLGFVWDPNITWWQMGDWHFALIGEAHAAYWHTDEADIHKNIGEFGVTPFIRFIKSSGWIRPYIQIGAGVRLLTSPVVASDYGYGSAFQFTPTGDIGVQIGSRQQFQAGYRFQHISNGGIKEPNPGINFSQLYLQYNF